MKIAVLMTCFNRRELTLAFLCSLERLEIPVDCTIDIYLNDDSSSDGTVNAAMSWAAGAIRTKVPVRLFVSKGTGRDYWCGGMRRAWKCALGSGVKYDYFLWANDDVVLYPWALVELLNSAKTRTASPVGIVCGCFCDPETKKLTYGGRDDQQLLEPNGVPQLCRYIHGNTVLVPSATYERIGIFDSRWTHGFGDSDYGLCCIEAGMCCLTTSRYIGECRQHRITAPWFSSEFPLRERIKLAQQPVGGNFKEFLLYRQKHYPRKWIVDALKFVLHVTFPVPFELYRKFKGE